MANIGQNVSEREEFWRPPMSEARDAAPLSRGEACERCGTDYVVGSRFCHVCGAARETPLSARRFSVSRWLDWSRIREGLGLGTGSLLAFVVGVVCVLAAVFTGIIYTASTVLDWQAVQVWRIEWLLAAIAAFAAGLLLKKAVA